MRMDWLIKVIPAVLALTGAALLAHWVAVDPRAPEVDLRVPGLDKLGAATQPAAPVVDLKGELVKGDGVPLVNPAPTANWPRFRGPKLDGISIEPVPLARQWKASGPTKLWSITLGEGYAGAAIDSGRAFLMDYDAAAGVEMVRCLSMQDGKEIWRRSYKVEINRNHGITRTTPAISGKYVVTIGSKCHVLCLEANSGEFVWGIDLPREYRTTVPPWYAGQCPLVDGDRVILAPAGESLMIAVEIATGKVIWKTPNPRKWEMTHSSIMPMTFAGQRMYIYCGSGGVVGVSADDGSILWDTIAWRVSMANVPSPLPIGEDRIFFCGGYGAGSMMIRLSQQEGKIVPTPVFQLKPEVFGAEQHTPIYQSGHIYGLIPGGQMVCLDLQGNKVWSSGAKNRFGIGPYMMADGMMIIVNDTGAITLAETTPAGFRAIARAELFEHGHEAWAPLALDGGRLLVRDMTRMICLDLRKASYE